MEIEKLVVTLGADTSEFQSALMEMERRIGENITVIETIQEKWDTAKTSICTVFTEIGDKLINMNDKFMLIDKIDLSGFNSVIASVKEGTESFIISPIRDGVIPILEELGNIFSVDLPGKIGGFSTVGEGFNTIALGIKGKIEEVNQSLVSWATNSHTTKENVCSAIMALGEDFALNINKIDTSIKTFVDSANVIWTGFTSKLMEDSKQNIGLIGELFGTKFTEIKGKFDLFINDSNGKWSSFFKEITSVSTVNLTGVVGKFTENFTLIETKTNSAFANIKNGVSTGLTAIKNDVTSKFNEISSYFKGLESQAVSWGNNISQGLSKGITSKFSEITSAVSSMATKISSTFTRAMDIHSPSKIMEKYGNFVTEGVAVGIKSAVNKPVRETISMAESIKNTAFSRLNGEEISVKNFSETAIQNPISNISTENTSRGISVDMSGATYIVKDETDIEIIGKTVSNAILFAMETSERGLIL